MKVLLKTSIFFVLVSLFSLHLSAQDQSRKKSLNFEEQAVKQTERMTSILDLNADQQAQIKAVHLKYAKQIASLKGDNSKSKEAKKEAFIANRKAKNSEIKSILTTEQFEKWKNVRKDFFKKKIENKEQNKKHKKNKSKK